MQVLAEFSVQFTLSVFQLRTGVHRPPISILWFDLSVCITPREMQTANEKRSLHSGAEVIRVFTARRGTQTLHHVF